MAPSTRDRISVDLRGLKAALFEQARARGISPSELIRNALVEALGQSDPSGLGCPAKRDAMPPEARVRLSLRMSRGEALAILAAARHARLSPSAFVAGLVAGVPVLAGGASRPDHIAALTASSAELSSLSRNIHHLATLLSHGNVGPALVYREMLDTLSGDVRGHLALAARVLAELQPRSRSAAPSKHPSA
jgi:hypothetical protein